MPNDDKGSDGERQGVKNTSSHFIEPTLSFQGKVVLAVLMPAEMLNVVQGKGKGYEDTFTI